MLDITALQAFAAGAALCSTSLGTTFTVLSTSGLTESRLGIVLTSAAMIDDLVGLVMVQVISSLGQARSSFSAVTVVRPIFVSIGFTIVIPLLCIFVVKPITVMWNDRRPQLSSLWTTAKCKEAMLISNIAILVVLVVISSYAGTSNLFAAYLAGVSISWWDGLCEEISKQSCESPVANTLPSNQSERSKDHETQQGESFGATAAMERDEEPATIATTQRDNRSSEMRGTFLYEHYFSAAVSTILKPLFFASIGFSIPITEMFSSSAVWRGMVYSVLMMFSKMLCGLGLIRISGPPLSLWALKRLMWIYPKTCWPKRSPSVKNVSSHGPTRTGISTSSSRTQVRPNSAKSERHQTRSTCTKPRSLYPAAILGSAMVARGEVGFLISSIAESNGLFGRGSDGSSSELFLVVTWAIFLCTITGPLVVGLLVKRVKRLQSDERNLNQGNQDPMGIWGIFKTS